MNVTELRKKRAALVVEARAILTQLQAETDDKRAKSIADKHDAVLAELDTVDQQLVRHESVERQERLDSNYRAGFDDAADEQRRAALRPSPGDMEVSAADGHALQTRTGWADKTGAEVRVLSRNENLATVRWDGPTLGEILRAMVTGPRNEAEKRALSEGTDSAGGFTVPTPLAAIWIDKLRAASVVMRAGAQTVDLTSDTLAIARQATDPTMAWRAESAEITASDPTFERVTFNTKSLASLVKVSRELLDDSINVAAMLENAFIQSAALSLDAAALYGATGGDNPVGVAGTSGINEVDMGTNGLPLTDYDPIVNAMYENELDNAQAPTAIILHPRTNRTMRLMKDGNALPMVPPPDVAKIQKLSTTSIPINETQGSSSVASSILLGYFPDLFIGVRQLLRIDVLKERYGEFLQYGFVAHMRADVQLAHKASFCRIKGIIP